MKLPIYIHRDIEPTLKRLVLEFPAVALTGPRQTGKSTLFKKLFSSTHRYVSFDDPANREKAIADPRLFLEKAGERVIFDEIQYVPGLVSYLKMIIDEHRHVKGRFLLTGSQQFSLIKGLSDSLAGRIGILELFPFSIHEKSSAPRSSAAMKTTETVFLDACLKGSFPELCVDAPRDVRSWYTTYVQTYLERDVRALSNIGDLLDFQRLLSLLAGRCGQILHLSHLSAGLGVSVSTVKRWISILEAGRIIFLLPPYFRNFGKRIVKSPKLYFFDCGLVCHLLSIQSEHEIMEGPMAGALFENFVLQEVMKKRTAMGIRNGLYYLRTNNGLEVDLLIQRGEKILPVEIKLSKTPRLSMARSLERFFDVFASLPLGNGIIVSLQDNPESLTRQISVQSLDALLRKLQ